MRIFFLIALISIQDLSAQRKNVVNYLDSVEVDNSYLLTSTNPDRGLLSAQMDVLNVDQELMNAAIFWELNAHRKRSSRAALKFSSELYHIGAAYIKRYTRVFFERGMEDQQRLNKPMTDAAKKLNYRKGIIRAFVFRFQAIDYNGISAFYYDSKSEEEDLNLFYGLMPDQKEREEVEKSRKAISNYSYKKFAEAAVRKTIARKCNRYLKSKSYSSMACYLVVDPSSLHKNQIPMVNCILIVSGSRLGLVSQK